jgi:glycosyltransferase involved in cell wall biosynthesis
MKVPVSILILARDEEANLPDCLHSVCGWAQEVFVVLDPRTTDRSREVAEARGAKVVEHLFEGYAAQKNWAIENLPWTSGWILIVDADERVSPELRQEIEVVVQDAAPKSAYAVRFRMVFYGRWMKHCWYGTWIIRLLRRGKARYEMRGVHEHVLVDGPIGYLHGDLIHNDFKDLDAWIAKHNRYATLEAEEAVMGSDGGHLEGRLFGTRLERRRFLKERVWKRLPFRPLWLFIYLYFFKLGFLDGRLGLRFCLWHAIFEAFVTGKVWEKRLLAKGPIPNYYMKEVEAYLAKHPAARESYSDGRRERTTDDD